jgi:hypothetical protein
MPMAINKLVTTTTQNAADAQVDAAHRMKTTLVMQSRSSGTGFLYGRGLPLELADSFFSLSSLFVFVVAVDAVLVAVVLR